MIQEILDTCPSCGAIWTLEEIEESRCGACGYNEDDDFENKKMTKEKLNQAKMLEKQINEFESANKCFWHEDELTKEGQRISTNPQIIIEFDCEDFDGRNQIKLPLILSNKFIEFMQSVIDEKIVELRNEFEIL
jgi:hypothetical protein